MAPEAAPILAFFRPCCNPEAGLTANASMGATVVKGRSAHFFWHLGAFFLSVNFRNNHQVADPAAGHKFMLWMVLISRDGFCAPSLRVPP